MGGERGRKEAFSSMQVVRVQTWPADRQSVGEIMGVSTGGLEVQVSCCNQLIAVVQQSIFFVISVRALLLQYRYSEYTMVLEYSSTRVPGTRVQLLINYLRRLMHACAWEIGRLKNYDLFIY